MHRKCPNYPVGRRRLFIPDLDFLVNSLRLMVIKSSTRKMMETMVIMERYVKTNRFS